MILPRGSALIFRNKCCLFWGGGGLSKVLPAVEMIKPRGLRLGHGQGKGQRSSYLSKYLSGL